MKLLSTEKMHEIGVLFEELEETMHECHDHIDHGDYKDANEHLFLLKRGIENIHRILNRH